MNVVNLQAPDGSVQNVPVQQLALEGMKIRLGPDCLQGLAKMSQSAIHVEARNDAAGLLWFATFGPALCQFLANHEVKANLEEQKKAMEKANGQQAANDGGNQSTGEKNSSEANPNDGKIIDLDPATGNAEGSAVQ